MNFARKLLLFVCAILLNACSVPDPAAIADMAAYKAELQEWQVGRLERLKAKTGYLNLVGLYWLKEGSNSIGSAPDNDVIFTAGAPAHIGVATLQDGKATMTVADGVSVYADGEPVTGMAMGSDVQEDAVLFTTGSLAWFAIEREGHVGIRLRDYDLPAVANFEPIDMFPVATKYRVAARLRAYDEPRIVKVGTVIEGLGWEPESPGVLEFEIDGKPLELEVYESGESVFIVFGDATSGKDTYPAGRFLYAEKPLPGEVTVIDFNRAYNPPCAFNDFATCPVASPRNRLAIAIEAGEKFNSATHLGALTH